jgi:chemotaxis protein MotB
VIALAPRALFVTPLIMSLAAFFLLSGCVTRGKYDEVVAERDKLMNQAEALQTRNASLAVTAVGLSRELALRDEEVAALQREQAELADEVARWAVRGAIRMQLLADGLHLILPGDLLFGSGSAALSADGEKLVKELVGEIGQQPYQIAVLGFTDNVPVGPALAERYPSNWELAGARAASVVRLMQAEGIPAAQLIAVSRGETGAIASNDTPEGRARNRRIDVRIRPIITE